MNKYLERFVTTDFVVGHANYFNNNHFRSKSDEVSPRVIEALNAQEGIIGAGKVYYNTQGFQIFHDGRQRGLQLYGLDDFPLSQLKIVEGELDWAKLQTGSYIIEGVFADDNGKIAWDIAGTLFSYGVIQSLAGNLWFFRYRFTILPLLLSAPLLIIISMVIPLAAYRATNRQSIVERLREAE